MRVTSGGKVHSYVDRALQELTVPSRRPLSRASPCLSLPRSIFSTHQVQQAMTITAHGAAVAKAVTVVEITKRRIRGLHQNTQIGLSTTAADSVPTITITLSMCPLDDSLLG